MTVDRSSVKVAIFHSPKLNPNYRLGMQNICKAEVCGCQDHEGTVGAGARREG